MKNPRVYNPIKPAKEPEPFKPLQELGEAPELPPFPVELLPAQLGDYACEISATVQCPVDLPAIAMLTATATAVQRVAMVHVGDTHREPLNLWGVIVADSSERKTETAAKVYSPTYHEQAELARRMAKEIEQATQRHRLQSMRIASLEKAYCSSKATGARLQELEHDLERAREELQEPPRAMRFTATDVTPETMATLLYENGGRISIIDAEGAGAIANGLNRYSDSGAKLENMLRSYRGDPIQVDRRNRTETVFAPHLTLALMLQTGVLARMGQSPEAREQGFAARFLYGMPKSKAGTRFYSNRRIHAGVASIYTNTLTRLLQLPSVTTVDEPAEFPAIFLTGEGLEIWREYHDAVEHAMRDNGSLADCRDFAGKLAGHAARIAGILAMVEQGSNAIGKPIPAATVDAACRMMRDYFQPHGLAAFKLMYDNEENSDAGRVVRWLKRHRGERNKWPIFSHADLYRDLRGSEDIAAPADLDGCLAELVDRGYLRRLEPEPTTGAGRKPSPRYEANPAAFRGDK